VPLFPHAREARCGLHQGGSGLGRLRTLALLYESEQELAVPIYRRGALRRSRNMSRGQHRLLPL